MLLSEIGEKGIVVHWPDVANPEGKYGFMLEVNWRQRRMGAAFPPGNLPNLNVVCAQLAGKASAGVFVNVNTLLPPGGGAPSGNRKPPQTPAIILYEGNDYYSIGLGELTTLEPDEVGDARVLVNRGAVIARIPQNGIPSGTWCVLINLSSLV